MFCITQRNKFLKFFMHHNSDISSFCCLVQDYFLMVTSLQQPDMAVSSTLATFLPRCAAAEGTRAELTARRQPRFLMVLGIQPRRHINR